MNENKVIKKLTIVVEILSVVFVFLYVYSNKMFKQINNLDELWNFNTAKNMSQGLLPYKDISMITTPLSPMIMSCLMNIFGISLYNYRVITSVFITLFFIVFYIVINVLTKKRISSLIVTLFIVSFYIEDIVYDYNYISLMLFMMAILLEIIIVKKYFEGNKVNNYFIFLVGFLIGLIIITKQTVGIVVSAGFIISTFLFTPKKSIKEKIKIILIKLIGISIPVLCFLIYLISTNSFSYFFDYCILGISDFDNKITLFDSIKSAIKKSDSKVIVALISFISITIFIVFNLIDIWIKLIKKKKIDIHSIVLVMLSLFCIISLVYVYPITDMYHILLSVLLMYILVFYTLFTYFKILDNTTVIYIIYAAFIFILIYLDVNACVARANLGNEYVKSKLKYFENLYIESAFEDYIQEVDEFIVKNESKGMKVYIADASAAIYEIPIDKYNKNYSMFLKGNLGKNEKESLINKIGNEKNVIYFVKGSESQLNWQTPKDILKHIKKKIKIEGMIGSYNYYYNE